MAIGRRAFLTAAAAVSTAGCATGRGRGSAGRESTPSEESQSPTPETTPTGEPPAFELVSVEAPERAEIGEQIQYSFTVRNAGGRTGTFSSTISTKVSGGEFGSGDPWETQIRPGGEATLRSQPFSIDYLTEATIRIDVFDREFSIQFISRGLAFGESYTNPDGMVMSVNRVEFQDSYSWTGSSGRSYQEDASQGAKWAFSYVSVENDSGSPGFTPLYPDFVILAGNRQYDPTYISKSEGRYEGAEVQPGVVRDGWIAYEVPDSLTLDELRVVWSETYYQGDVAVHWSSGG